VSEKKEGKKKRRDKYITAPKGMKKRCKKSLKEIYESEVEI
jgi:hypothetical protein